MWLFTSSVFQTLMCLFAGDRKVQGRLESISQRLLFKLQLRFMWSTLAKVSQQSFGCTPLQTACQPCASVFSWSLGYNSADERIGAFFFIVCVKIVDFVKKHLVFVGYSVIV